MVTIKFKNGKNMFPNGIKAPMVWALGALVWWCNSHDIDELIITAGDEPGHPGTINGPSYHGEGLAIDIRIHGWDDDRVQNFLSLLRSYLGRLFDVVLEARGTPDEHIHIEYDRRRAEAEEKNT